VAGRDEGNHGSDGQELPEGVIIGWDITWKEPNEYFVQTCEAMQRRESSNVFEN